MEERKICWIAWNKVCASKDHGGLGIGSLSALNLALISKWWWRFKTEPNSLWCTIIKSIHGDCGGLDPLSVATTGIWGKVASLQFSLSKANISLEELFKWNLGNGRSIPFWHHDWLGLGKPLKKRFNRLYSLESNKNCCVADRCLGAAVNSEFDLPVIDKNGSVLVNLGPSATTGHGWNWARPIRSLAEHSSLSEIDSIMATISLSNKPDWWEFSLSPNRIFCVNNLRIVIDKSTLNNSGSKIRWNKILPIKVNIFSWRVGLNRLPTRDNLVIRNIDIHSSRCPVCDDAAETMEHLFVHCQVARSIWNYIRGWWQIQNPIPSSSLGLLCWTDSSGLNKIMSAHFDVVVQTTLWSIWKNRNLICFQQKHSKTEAIFDGIVLFAYNWIKNRSKMCNIRWLDWQLDPQSCYK